MTSSLPSLIWTAISYKDQFYTRTNYKTEADETQGDAEIAILKLQKSLPDMPHLMTLPVTYKMRQWDILSPPKARAIRSRRWVSNSCTASAM